MSLRLVSRIVVEIPRELSLLMNSSMSSSRDRVKVEPLGAQAHRGRPAAGHGADNAEVARQLGVSEQTYYRWRNQCGGLATSSPSTAARDECQNINLFWSLAHAKVVISDWKEEYNLDRPYSSLGYLSPTEYAAVCNH